MTASAPHPTVRSAVSRRRFTQLGAALVGSATPAALAVGCGAGAGTPAGTTSTQPVKLVYLGLESPGFLQPDAIKNFTQRYPHVTVEETYTAGAPHMEKVQTQAAA